MSIDFSLSQTNENIEYYVLNNVCNDNAFNHL